VRSCVTIAPFALGMAMALLALGCAARPAPEPVDPFAPIGPSAGVDAFSLLVRDDEQAVWRALAGVIAPPAQADSTRDGEDALFETEEDRARFRSAMRERGALDRSMIPMVASGLWIVPLSREEFASFMALLSQVGGADRTLIDASGSWRVGLDGGPTPSTIRTDLGETRLGAGKMRLLARAWVAPGVTLGPGGDQLAAELRLDLVPQHVGPSVLRIGEQIRAVSGLVGEGQVLDRMLVELPIGAGSRMNVSTGNDRHRVYLLLEGEGRESWLDTVLVYRPEPPSPTGPAAGADTAASPGQREQPGAQDNVGFNVGPMPDQIPSIGSSLLPRTVYAGSPLRRIGVLIPRGPGGS